MDVRVNLLSNCDQVEVVYTRGSVSAAYNDEKTEIAMMALSHNAAGVPAANQHVLMSEGPAGAKAACFASPSWGIELMPGGRDFSREWNDLKCDKWDSRYLFGANQVIHALKKAAGKAKHVVWFDSDHIDIDPLNGKLFMPFPDEGDQMYTGGFVNVLELIRLHPLVTFGILSIRCGFTKYVQQAVDIDQKGLYPPGTDPATWADLSKAYPNLALLSCSEGGAATHQTLLVRMSRGKYRVFTSTAFRAVGQQMPLMQADETLCQAAQRVNAAGRFGHKLVAVIGGDKPASWVLVPGQKIGDLDATVVHIDDRYDDDEKCVTLTGHPAKVPAALRFYKKERGNSVARVLRELLASSLTVKEAVDKLAELEDFRDKVTVKTQPWVTDERMTPVHQVLLQLFIGRYQDLVQATRVQAAILEGRVKGEAVISALTQIARANPKA